MPRSPSQKSIDVCRFGADDRDVVHALGLELSHSAHFPRSTSVGLVLAAPQAPPRHELDSGLDDEDASAVSRESRRRANRCSSAPARAPRVTGNGGSCLTPSAAGRTRMWPLTSGANDATTSRTAEGKTLTPRTMSMSSVRPTHRTRGAVRPHGQRDVRTTTWSFVRKRSSGAARCRRCVRTSSPVALVRELDRRARLRVDQLRVHESASPEVHAVLRGALAPERRPDVADPHRLEHLRPPSPLEHRPELGLASTRLPRDQNPFHARVRESDTALGRELGEVRGVRRREHRGVGAQQRDRLQQELAVPRADGDVACADPVERRERDAGDERAGVVGRDDALARCETRGGIAPRRADDPVVEVRCGERDVARRSGRPARRVDPNDLVRPRAEVRADRVVAGDGRAKLAFRGQRQLGDRLEPARLAG